VFWLAISPYKIDHQCKNIMSTLWHRQIKTCSCKMSFYWSWQNILFFSPIKPVSNWWKNYVLERKKSLGYKCILNCFNQILSTTCKQRWFLIIKNPRSSKNCFGCGSSFLKDYFATKENDMELEDIFGPFFAICHLPLKDCSLILQF